MTAETGPSAAPAPAATPRCDIAARVFAQLDHLAGGAGSLGLAVSGGGDSMALLHLACGWARARARPVALRVATVDHRLRPESGDEAWGVAAVAQDLGLTHDTLDWTAGPPPTGNLAAQAREARLALLGDWARAGGLDAVLLGHSRDDVAETLVMRLGRGAGIEGLAAMADRREAAGMVWLRPLLGVGRGELREWLAARGIAWVDDPGNDDPSSDRARIRHALAAAGLDPARLAESAAHLGQVRTTLGQLALDGAGTPRFRGGAVTIRLARFRSLPPELQRILLLALVRTVTGGGYPPRRAAQAAALAALAEGRRATLGGALVTAAGRSLRLGREPAAAARAPPLERDGLWDGRWRIEGLPPGCEIRALGAGALRRAATRLRMDPDLAATLPGLWRGDALVCAPGLSRCPPEAAGLRAASLCTAGALGRTLLGR